MIPDKKKTPEEIAALREGLGIPDSPVAPTGQQEIPPPSSPTPAAVPSQEAGEPVIHLPVPSLPIPPVSHKPHSLRRQEMPLAPAPPVTKKTPLPTHRHDPSDIAEIRKREALAKLQTPGFDPGAHLRQQTASPFLYAPGYLLAIAAAAAAFKRVHHITPIVLLALALLITLYIAIRKPRSRHHAALIFILVFLTAAFGGIHYAPLFKHGP